MREYTLAAPGRVCALTGRTLVVGDAYYGVLTEQAGKLVRTEIAEDAWQGPPSEAIAFWRGRIPATATPRKPTLDDEHVLAVFRQFATATEARRRHLRYVLALLLIRRKQLVLEDTRSVRGQDILLVREARRSARHEVPDPQLTAAEMAAVQDEVLEVLNWE
ncbi:MAG: hypothetical protein ACRCZF_05275 [Gemmataceae bacterium]